jgi:hypothetical protein
MTIEFSGKCQEKYQMLEMKLKAVDTQTGLGRRHLVNGLTRARR